MFLPADDQDKDGFKLENVGANVFKFRCRNALKIGCTCFGSTFRLTITINISLN